MSQNPASKYAAPIDDPYVKTDTELLGTVNIPTLREHWLHLKLAQVCKIHSSWTMLLSVGHVPDALTTF